jgi:hypothetical protein
MSTHAVFGVKYPDGKISGCYVHYDGATMRSRIEDYLVAHTTTCLSMLIAKAQGSGGMRGFHSPGLDEGDPVTDFLEDGDVYTIDETDFYNDHFGAHYWYLVDYNTGEIRKRSN